MAISANLQKAQQAVEVGKDVAIGATGFLSAAAGYLTVINGTLAVVIACITIAVLFYRFKINRREWNVGEEERRDEEAGSESR